MFDYDAEQITQTKHSFVFDKLPNDYVFCINKSLILYKYFVEK